MDPALFRAAHTGDVEALDNLLKEHPRICNQFTGRNNTALHFAAEHGHSQFVRKLLDVKPGLSGLVNRDGNTALHGASKQGHSEVVSILLHHNKLDAHALNLYGESALFMASEEGHVAVVSQLLQVHSPRIKLDFKRRSDGQTCCHAASQHGHLGVVIELIRRRPDMIVSVDKYGATPLHSAVSAGHTQIVRELVRSVPSLCYKLDRGGRSPLHVAAMKGYVSVVQELLCLRPDCMESLSKDGKTALHVAAENDQIQVIKYLLETQTMYMNLLNERDNEGNTVLHLATTERFQQMVELLLSFPKLKVNAMNEQGHTALDIACKDTDHVASMRGIVEALERKGGMKRSGNGSNKCVKKLKKLGDSPGISTVVAALITTLTFDAVFAVPGWNQNDIYTNWNQNISFPGLTAQSPNPPLTASLNLGRLDAYEKWLMKYYVRGFMLCDTFAFLAAVNVIVIWMVLEPLQVVIRKKLMWFSNAILGVALISTCLAFIAASNVVAISWYGNYAGVYSLVCLSVIAMPVLFVLLTEVQPKKLKFFFMLIYLGFCSAFLLPCVFEFQGI